MDYFKIYKNPYFSTKMGLFSGCGGKTRTYDLRVMRKYSNFSPFYFHDSLILFTFFIYSIKAYISNPFYFFKRLINILHFELLLTIHSLLSISCNPTKIYGNIKYNNKSGWPQMYNNIGKRDILIFLSLTI